MEESWHPVPGEPYYEVSTTGCLRSLDRMVPRRGQSDMPVKGRVLRGTITKDGHVRVTLDGRRLVFLHQLVAAAFIGPCPDGMEVCHRNGNGLDNRPDNLYYGTHGENISDAARHGTHNMARKTHCKHGHEYTPENTAPNRMRDGQPYGRRCRTCARLQARASKRRKRAAGH